MLSSVSVIFLQVITIALLIRSGCGSQNSSSTTQFLTTPPVFRFFDIFFRISNGPSGWRQVGNVGHIRGYYTNKTPRLQFRCLASYPIQITVDGYINPPENIEFHPFHRRRFNEENNYYGLRISAPDISNGSDISEIAVYFGYADDEARTQDVSASVEITCHGIGSDNELMRESFRLFFEGPHRLLVNKGETLTVTNSQYLPCPTTNPSILVELRLGDMDSAETKKIVRWVFYDPVAGNFTCTSRNDSVIIVSLVQNSLHMNYTNYARTSNSDFYFPNETVLFSHIDDQLHFHCKSTFPIEVYKNDRNAVINYTINTKFEKKFVLIGGTTGDWRYIGCQKIRNNTKSDIFRWQYMLKDYPLLYLKNKVRKIECSGDILSLRSMVQVKCDGPVHCQFMRQCVDNPGWCNKTLDVYSYAETTSQRGYCPNAGSCANELNILHLSGLIKCTNHGTSVIGKQHSRVWQYFTALNYLKYKDYREVEDNDLIRLDELEPILYTNHTNTFTCEAVAFLFADSIKFSIEMRNGSQEFIYRTKYSGTGLTSAVMHPRKVNWLNVIDVIEVKLPLDAVAVHCHVPWWNSTEYKNASRRFETRDLIAAKIVPTKKSHDFINGETYRKLTCRGMGEPTPTYEWYFNDKKINPKTWPEVSTSFGLEGEGFLDFEKVSKNMTGNYSCTARNRNGTDRFNFTVNVEDQAEEYSLSAFWTSIGVAGFVLVVLMLIIAILYRRYRLAKLNSRLHEDDIDKFFNGQSDFHGKHLTQENANCWPYDKSFEIEWDDMEFDPSNVLGSGNFGTVLKGVVLSRGIDVAIKFPKAAPLREELKAVLTEIKVMIHMGQHVNVIKFIGACTHFIREGKVFVLMELSENGCLQSYIRKRKPNDDIDPDTECLNSEMTISEVQLVRWAFEIAKGMEYLAYKLIVHADLATRNVLLDKELTAKISDFGLSRQLYQSSVYKKTKTMLPWRWMAPESLTSMEFSTESDVWSFGVTVWEIFAFGAVPYANATWSLEFVNMLMSGVYLAKPRDSPVEIHGVITLCWNINKTNRPTFTSLRQQFHEILKNTRKVKCHMNS